MKKYLNLCIIVAVLTISLISFRSAQAHGLATTKTELVNNYLVQLEYDTLGNINAGDVTSFSFEILDPNTKASVDFDRVYVNIRKSSGPLAFFSNLLPMEGFTVKSARASIYVPDEGEYNIQVNYYKGEKELAEHTFKLQVDPPYKFPGTTEKSTTTDIKKYIWVIALIGGIILGMGASKLMKQNGKKD